MTAPVRRAVRDGRALLAAAQLAAGRSRWDFFRMLRQAGPVSGGDPRPVRVRSLGGTEIWLRPGTTDAEVADATFNGGYHLPPPEAGSPELVWDLGCNIGLTMLDIAAAFPGARVVGVELSPENAALAWRNLESVSDRCEVIEAAVWTRPGTVPFGTDGREDGYRVSEGGDRKARTITLGDLLERTGAPDYVKLDVEGSELALLRESTEWAAQVGAISVECHPPYNLAECRQDLEALGFDVTELRQTRRRRARDCAVGLRSVRAGGAAASG